MPETARNERIKMGGFLSFDDSIKTKMAAEVCANLRLIRKLCEVIGRNSATKHRLCRKPEVQIKLF